MQAIWNGHILAESDDTVIVEGNHYFPIASIDRTVFQDSPTHTICSWKGTASYYTVIVDGQSNPDAAWYYPDPKPEAAHVKDRIAFWHGVTVTP